MWLLLLFLLVLNVACQCLGPTANVSGRFTATAAGAESATTTLDSCGVLGWTLMARADIGSLLLLLLLWLWLSSTRLFARAARAYTGLLSEGLHLALGRRARRLWRRAETL